MFLRKYVPAVVAAIALSFMPSCNSTTEDDVEITQSSAVVKSFSFSADADVMRNLDSVYFSIDLVKGLIFNADSMPYGTDVSKLVPVISTLQTSSVLELKVKRANNTDTTYNYLTNSTDTIDFTNPVTIRVVSKDGLTERSYKVSVNVHNMKTDSLTWHRDKRTALPTTFGYPAAQRTVRSGSTMYCLTRSESSYCMASYSGRLAAAGGALVPVSAWTTQTITFPFTPVVESLAASDDALYILADNGALYASADGGTSWTATGRTWHHIYGGYADRVMGAMHTASGWKIDSYPTGEAVALPESMPISGTSAPVYYTFAMSANAQMLVVGGVMVDGKLSAATWGYDGSSWMKVSKRDLPEALTDVAVAPYSSQTGSSYTGVVRPTLITLGGRNASGKPVSTVYISSDYGYIWKEAGQLMQLPDYMGAFYGAQAFVEEAPLNADLFPRIAKPTEQWDCPYIFLFGGFTEQGTLRNTVWRGVINRFTFKPVE